jgi:hypothetical protein
LELLFEIPIVWYPYWETCGMNQHVIMMQEKMHKLLLT